MQDAAGAVLAHSREVDGRAWKKGRILSQADVDAATGVGITTLVVARLGSDDVLENAAAAELANHLNTWNVAQRAAMTGRVNLYAERAGVFQADRNLVSRLNAVDPAITFATLREGVAVQAGQLVATVKIIPFAVPRGSLEAAVSIVGEGAIIGVEAFHPLRVGLIQTTLPSTSIKMLDKTAAVTRRRLARSGSSLVEEMRVAHDQQALEGALRSLLEQCEMVFVFGASAVSDPEDVIPAAIRRAGGSVERVGMPVDPGNLLVLGDVEGKPVVGAPGCARSPKENGFDWVLDRLTAKMTITSNDIAELGVGGLLAEISSRPAPRDSASARDDGGSSSEARPISAIVLAAGRSSRMGDDLNKLLAEFDGVPLVRRSVGEVCRSPCNETVVVVGHQSDAIRRALSGMPVRFVENSNVGEGLSASLKAGIAAISANTLGVLVVLADMPRLTAADLEAMTTAFAQSGFSAIIRATHGGKRGNPVLLPRATFAEVAALEGDVGARSIVESGAYDVVDVEIGEAASLDVDTQEAMRAAGGVFVRGSERLT
nr:molybdopterin-binding/glycosyltransferase family 2 protein [Tianweitania sediminis]